MISKFARRPLAVGAILVIGLSGCSADPASSTEVGGPVVLVDATPATELDRYHPSDQVFFDQLSLDGLITVPPPDNLAVATKQSTATVVATVVDVRPARAIVGETPDDVVRTIGIVLRPVETLHGRLRPELPEVVVEFLVLGDAVEQLSTLRSGLPRGQSVWFLRWQGENWAAAGQKPGARPPSAEEKQLYGLVHLQGLFVQGPGRVVSAVWAQDEPVPAGTTLKSHGESFRKLTDLVTYVRSVG